MNKVSTLSYFMIAILIELFMCNTTDWKSEKQFFFYLGKLRELIRYLRNQFATQWAVI